jgi:SAM-dependent methyltransferase
MKRRLYSALSRVKKGPSIVVQAAKNELAVRRAIVRGEKPAAAPKDWFSGVDDETWLWMNTTGRRRRESIARLLPGMPERSIQEGFTGCSGDATLVQGFQAYRLFKKCYETHAGPIESCCVLDFGCGWGRIIRFFLKDVEPGKLLGVDLDANAIRICRETNRWCKFRLIDPHPPTPLTAESFGLIYLYSVFSHLPEEMHWMLLEEFHRLLVPGGMLIATTRARDFIHYCQSLRDNPQVEKPGSVKGIFLDVDAAIWAYDNGQFCYDCYGEEGPRSFWGETCISKSYVDTRWQKIFEVCDYIEDRGVSDQNVIVARKRVL